MLSNGHSTVYRYRSEFYNTGMQLYGTGSADLQFRITEPDPGGQIMWNRNTAHKWLVLPLSSVGTGSVTLMKTGPWAPPSASRLPDRSGLSFLFRRWGQGPWLCWRLGPGSPQTARPAAARTGPLLYFWGRFMLPDTGNHFTLHNFYWGREGI